MILRISRGTRRTFSTQEVRRKMIFPHYLRSLHDVLMNGKVMFQSSKKEKQKGDIFFSMKYHLYWLLKGPCFELLWDGKYGLFWAKKVAEIWYLLITEKFLFWTFREREMRPFLRQKVDEKLVFTDYRKVLVLNFYVMGNTVFFETKRWWKDYIYWLLKIFCYGLPKRSCFEHFGDGKYGLFEPKSWCKGNIYFGFLNCPWYSKTREIRFFVQC